MSQPHVESGEQSRVIDLRIISAARDGSVAAFDLLVDRYYDDIARYLFRLVGDRELAADLTQETFLVAYTALHQLSDDRPFSAWLYRVALNRARPVLRRRALLRFVPLDHVAHLLGGLVGRGGTEHFDAVAEREVVQRVLDQLPDGQRIVLLLHSMVGFTAEEISLIVGTSPGAAARQVSRARERFRQLHASETRTAEADGG
jgi:RNA polymerase sigma-70 factor, ECF subfamily